jgi:hypothetical protein
VRFPISLSILYPLSCDTYNTIERGDWNSSYSNFTTFSVIVSASPLTSSSLPFGFDLASSIFGFFARSSSSSQSSETALCGQRPPCRSPPNVLLRHLTQHPPQHPLELLSFIVLLHNLLRLLSNDGPCTPPLSVGLSPPTPTTPTPLILFLQNQLLQISSHQLLRPIPLASDEFIPRH